jgi:predicted transcriptional regulator
MGGIRTISFRVDADKVAELDAIAGNLERDRSYLLNEALENYLEEQRQIISEIGAGLEDARSGNLVDDEEVDAIIEGWAGRAQERKRRKTA